MAKLKPIFHFQGVRRGGCRWGAETSVRHLGQHGQRGEQDGVDRYHGTYPGTIKNGLSLIVIKLFICVHTYIPASHLAYHQVGTLAAAVAASCTYCLRYL